MRLAPQVGEAMINANRNLSAYESFGVPVWPDSLADYAGPLAGFLTGLERCETGYLRDGALRHAAVPAGPGRAPGEALEREGAEIAMAAAREEDGQFRAQPVFSLLRRELMESLVRFTHGGGRKIDAWTAQHRTCSSRSTGRATTHRPSSTPTRWPNCTGSSSRHERTIAEIAAQLQGYDPQALSRRRVGEFLARLVRRCARPRQVACSTRWTACWRATSSRRSACRRTTTPRWTATPSTARSSRRGAAAAAGGGHGAGRQGLAGPVAPASA
jgi:molybdopterin-guanine dinucleotide biosynthesis protein A